MKPRTEKPNVYELLNRSQKVARMVLTAEELVSDGFDHTDLIGAMGRWDDGQWRQLSVISGCKSDPSPATRSDVMAMLRERAGEVVL